MAVAEVKVKSGNTRWDPPYADMIYGSTIRGHGKSSPLSYDRSISPDDVVTHPSVFNFVMEVNLNKVRELRRLDHSWDGYGAPEIRRDVIDDGIAIIETLSAQPNSINPTRKGTIRFEYSNANANLYIELLGCKRFSAFTRSVASKKISKEKEHDLGSLDEIVRSFKHEGAL